MKAVVYRRTGGSDVLEVLERDAGEPGPGEVRVRIVVSGVNPTDWKSRSGFGTVRDLDVPQVPHQDGAGIVDAVGPGVDALEPGQRVWVWDAAHGRPEGTAQEFALVPAANVVPLPDSVSFEVGASLGIPALTAHRVLTSFADAPEHLGPGTLDGRVVLVAGGAGAVGHAAIQLAKWSGATVITTVSGPEKAVLAERAGADVVVNYRTEDAAERIREHAPDGVDLVAEVAPTANAELDVEVTAPNGTVAVYASDSPAVPVPIRPSMTKNLRWQFLMTYQTSAERKRIGVEDVRAAAAAGVLAVGEDAGLPLVRFPLDATAAAHDAVEGGAVGKVLIDVSPEAG
ncbi:MAG: NADPH:quinone reductase [Naasia sp.]|nr:NADPH:quinone reductase [Naasia sp.]